MRGLSVRQMRTCLFCPNVANTKEDMWPDWLIRCVGEDRNSPSQYWRSTFAEPKTWAGPRFKVKNVCEDCNGVWMSDLENAVRRPMGCLINDLSIPLSCDDQYAIARWCCKTAMVIEGAKQDKNKFYGDEDRKNLRTMKAMPPDTWVWLGRCAQSYLLHAEARMLHVRRQMPNIQVRDGCATTFVIKNLILQMLSVHRAAGVGEGNLRIEIQGGDWHRSLIQVWPHLDGTTSWPPPQPFAEHDESLRKLIRRFVVGVRLVK
jgi:hypothetical protein